MSTDRIDIFINRRLAEIMEAHGVGVSVARSIIDDLMNDVKAEYGCDRHYIPAPSKKNRDAMIVTLSTQANPRLNNSQISERLGVSVATVKRVIAARRRTKSQSVGLGSAEWNI